MIFGTPHFYRGWFVLIKNARDVGVHPIAQFAVGQEWEAIPGWKNDLD
jgi:hypothetical protein